jgi:hypothetical protein
VLESEQVGVGLAEHFRWIFEAEQRLARQTLRFLLFDSSAAARTLGFKS